MKNISDIVINALEKVVSSPVHDEDQIAQYFSPDYQQSVDGQQLTYADFVRHMETLKSVSEKTEITVKTAVAEGDTVFTHHYVNVEKSRGGKSEFEVFACFTLSAGKIIRCEELTRMLNGDAEDQDLASRK